MGCGLRWHPTLPGSAAFFVRAQFKELVEDIKRYHTEVCMERALASPVGAASFLG